MNLFPLVKSVLDELYVQIPLPSDKEKDKVIRDQIKALRNEYQELGNGITIDYNHSITRFVYMYSYVTAHAFTIYALIRDTPHINHIFNKNQLNVCCLGGPGSDLLGMLKYIKTRKKSTTLTCRIYDRQDRWRESLGTVCNKLTSFNIIPTFRQLDITDPEAWAKCPEIQHNNLFTMSYLVSEVCSKQVDGSYFFRNLFWYADTGSVFLFIDNRSGYASHWFDRLVREYNQSVNSCLRCIKASDRYGFQMENSERVKDLEPYYSKYSEAGVPKMSAPIDLRIYLKE